MNHLYKKKNLAQTDVNQTIYNYKLVFSKKKKYIKENEFKF